MCDCQLDVDSFCGHHGEVFTRLWVCSDQRKQQRSLCPFALSSRQHETRIPYGPYRHDRHQVLIYLRWAQWLFRCGLRHLNHVVINMDETSVSASHDTDKGWVVNAGVRASSNLTTVASRSGGPVLSCTLLGCICSDSAVQPHLPQVLLPKARRAELPQYVLDQFSACGAPLEFWHGTNGWVDYVSMKHWATRLRSVVQSCHGL